MLMFVGLLTALDMFELGCRQGPFSLCDDIDHLELELAWVGGLWEHHHLNDTPDGCMKWK